MNENQLALTYLATVGPRTVAKKHADITIYRGLVADGSASVVYHNGRAMKFAITDQGRDRLSMMQVGNVSDAVETENAAPLPGYVVPPADKGLSHDEVVKRYRTKVADMKASHRVRNGVVKPEKPAVKPAMIPAIPRIKKLSDHIAVLRAMIAGTVLMEDGQLGTREVGLACMKHLIKYGQVMPDGTGEGVYAITEKGIKIAATREPHEQV